ncbi:FMN-binding protein [Sulfurimonas sediminis]|uniref:FMN-binding protein n=1 Tax=Sulfurimonas sediminis TaxID=2590020 RepID=A0A7M1B4U2_9BACT|nr:FMN-binding protein [Sulfurimonas sediminis]QOP43738.1 FMN-binding protein [Sulfurimonas sediminis]
MKYISLFILLLTQQLSAQLLVSPIDAMKENFDRNATITKKNILLTHDKFKTIQKNAGVKLTTKIYRVYIAKKNGKILGYGVLVNRKVRSKNAVTLYFFKDSVLQGIEVIAFNETLEYLPPKRWTQQFENRKTDKVLKLNREITNISGATMSAKSLTDGSRIAFAIYNMLYKDK